MISDQSLLLSTIVLNDTVIIDEYYWDESHTSKNSMTVLFTKIYMEIWINDMSVIHSHKKSYLKQNDLQVLPDVHSSHQEIPG